MTSTIHHGDCLEVLRTLPDASVDAVVTDPPAGIGFMGKSWDKDKGGRREWVAWLTEIMAETRRVMKPGAYALVWALPRTSHWTGWAIEDGGLLIQDRISHLFGNGFPKSKTHLKPACEDWWLAYKKGKRALNIEACRVGHSGSRTNSSKPRAARNTMQSGIVYGTETIIRDCGRWPANVTHDGSDEVVGLFPATGPSSARPRNNGEFKSQSKGRELPHVTFGHADSGGSAARFFYCAKVSRRDREGGLDGYPLHDAHLSGHRKINTVKKGDGVRINHPRANHHPTCKSTELMRWLCRLITPPGGIILDPFMGSGSTGKAAALEGFSFIGIEREAEYVEIARARIAHVRGLLFAEAAG